MAVKMFSPRDTSQIIQRYNDSELFTASSSSSKGRELFNPANSLRDTMLLPGIRNGQLVSIRRRSSTSNHTVTESQTKHDAIPGRTKSRTPSVLPIRNSKPALAQKKQPSTHNQDTYKWMGNSSSKPSKPLRSEERRHSSRNLHDRHQSHGSERSRDENRRDRHRRSEYDREHRSGHLRRQEGRSRREVDHRRGVYDRPEPEHRSRVPAPPEAPPIQKHDCLVCQESFTAADLYETICHHFYCRGCILDRFDMATKDSSLMPVKCCGGIELDINHVRQTFSGLFTLEFKQLWRKKYAESKDSNPIYCPKKNCSTWMPKDLFKSDRKGKGYAFARCSNCDTRVCKECKREYHGDKKCRPDKATREVLKLIEEDPNSQQCPRCHTGVQKTAGCNHMKCVCGMRFCIRCGGSITDTEADSTIKRCTGCPIVSYNADPEEDARMAREFRFDNNRANLVGVPMPPPPPGVNGHPGPRPARRPNGMWGPHGHPIIDVPVPLPPPPPATQFRGFPPPPPPPPPPPERQNQGASRPWLMSGAAHPGDLDTRSRTRSWVQSYEPPGSSSGHTANDSTVDDLEFAQQLQAEYFDMDEEDISNDFWI